MTPFMMCCCVPRIQDDLLGDNGDHGTNNRVPQSYQVSIQRDLRLESIIKLSGITSRQRLGTLHQIFNRLHSDDVRVSCGDNEVVPRKYLTEVGQTQEKLAATRRPVPQKILRVSTARAGESESQILQAVAQRIDLLSQSAQARRGGSNASSRVIGGRMSTDGMNVASAAGPGSRPTTLSLERRSLTLGDTAAVFARLIDAELEADEDQGAAGGGGAKSVTPPHHRHPLGLRGMVRHRSLQRGSESGHAVGFTTACKTTLPGRGLSAAQQQQQQRVPSSTNVAIDRSSDQSSGSKDSNIQQFRRQHQSSPLASLPPSSFRHGKPVTDLDQISYFARLVTQGRPLSVVVAELR